MSIIRDIRIVTAQHISLPSTSRQALVEFFNALDMELDKEGYEPNDDVKKALKKFETSLLDIEDVVSSVNEESIFDDDDIDDIDFVDIDDIDVVDPSTEE